MSKVYGQVGVSVTLTSLTNALAFAIGALVPTPELRAFCVTAGVAITIDWLYQLAFFAGVLVICGLGNKQMVGDQTDAAVEVEIVHREKTPSQLSKAGTVVLVKDVQRPSWLIRTYCRWLMSWWGEAQDFV